MKTRLLTAVMVFVLAMSLAPIASAQNSTCYNLSEEDCALIDAAFANTADITSFAQTFSLDFELLNLELLQFFQLGLPPGFTLNVDGIGVFSTLPEDPAAEPVLALDMLVDIDDTLAPVTDVEVPLVIADGMVYLPGDGEIVALPFDTLGGVDVPMVGGLLPIDPEELANSDPATFGELLPPDLGMALNPSGTDISFAADYVRLDDVELMGQTMYPFQFTLDIGSMLNSPEFLQFVQALAPALGSMGEEANPMMGMVVQLIPTLLSGVSSDMVVTQYVGADDNYIHKLTFDLTFEIDLSVLTAGSVGNDNTTIPPLTANILFDVEISDINAPVEVTAPEGARELTPEEIDALLDFDIALPF